MPSRQEIAGWLREASDLAYDYSPKGINHYNTFNKRAAQVDQMRCETCSDRFKITGNDGEGIPCPWMGCGGCFHHKFNEVENG